MPYSKLYILTERSANDVTFISVEDRRQTFQYTYTYGTENSIFVEIQPDSTNIKMTLVFIVHSSEDICLHLFHVPHKHWA